MELGLSGKLVLVTGSTAGIGYAIAECFLKNGSFVIINGRNEEKVQEAVGTLNETYGEGKAIGVASDVSKDDGIKAIQDKLEELEMEVEVLINNVGIYNSKDFFEIDIEEWENIFNVNVFSMVRTSRAFLKGMLERNSGRIINIASEAGMRPLSDMIHYSTTKTAVIGLSRGLAELTRGTNVTVNSLLVGTTMTPGVQKYVSEIAESNNISEEEQSKRFFQEFDRAFSLIQRFINPEEIGNTCVFLASQASSCINGSAVRAEGGLLGHI
eukprot:TRINITY_DN285_c0_g1_i1.p1 TRINITY_DN285_c0_g1~~TRINITY_DN285_c0_g1_i1.p1  ORF type:complete len:269 (-),score=106.52 TRINITY_DN285_c0_g1_i1:16-822(-)